MKLVPLVAIVLLGASMAAQDGARVDFSTVLESGFPYGRDQFVSAAATSWAALALTKAQGQP